MFGIYPKKSYICVDFIVVFVILTNVATKIQQILEANPSLNVLFGEWLASQGLDAKGQHSYMKSGLSRGVYALLGSTPTLYNVVSAYNTQLDKHCIVGAYTALELRGYSHYLSMGRPTAFLFTSKDDKLPAWMLQLEWDMGIKYMTTSFLGDDRKGVESLDVDGNILLASSPERAILECLNLPDSSASLLDIYYIMESLTTLRPKLVQALLEACTSQKVKRLFVYMAEKSGHSWFKALDIEKIQLGKSRYMVVSTGKYIAKYNMTIPKELAEYE